MVTTSDVGGATGALGGGGTGSFCSGNGGGSAGGGASKAGEGELFLPRIQTSQPQVLAAPDHSRVEPEEEPQEWLLVLRECWAP